MCGKFEVKRTLAQILADFNVETSLAGLSHFSAALPGMTLPVIAKGRLGLARWSWPLENETRPLINIRSESVHQKPLFAPDWAAGHRCVAPATGFFEKGRLFCAADHEIFGLCGLWTRTPDEQVCFALLTQEAGDPVKPFHHRMPVIVDVAGAALWCASGASPTPLPLMLKDLAGKPALL
ncbi:MAG: hypothetical protein EBQ96_07480 [Proteobacteria bacterium]|nr:hypothetical protein [Pseudomonadota bacterium]